MVLTKNGAAALTLTMVEDGRSCSLPDFPAGGGNPVLTVFLESVTRAWPP